MRRSRQDASMSHPSYANARYPVHEDLQRTHQEAFRRFANAGTWFTGEQRVAIAAEARAARDCALCRERKSALSPFSVDGEHDGPGELAPELVDVIHRVITDPGRLSRSWYERVIGAGAIDDAGYVELVAVSVVLNAIDVFARAVGLESAPLPEPEAGAPSSVRPASARHDGAWVPQIPAGAEGGDDWHALYADRESVPQIGRALSLVPAEVEMLQAISGPHYMELDKVADPKFSMY
jgi:hypothetical protein